MSKIDFRPYFHSEKTIKFPRKFVTSNSIPEVLSEAKFLFESNSKAINSIAYECGNIRKLSILGVLLIYKIVDYAYKNHHIRQAELKGDIHFLVSVWKHYGFSELMNSYFRSEHSLKSYRFLEFRREGNIIIAPQPLLREEHSVFNEFLQKEFTPKLKAFYVNQPKVVDMIFGCISEIIGNFWEHSTDDNSLVVAEGGFENIYITYADTGNGIVSTMRNSKIFGDLTSSERLLEKAISKGVTSKPKSNHMGYGLWIVDELVSRAGGTINIFTEGLHYSRLKGSKRIVKADYWRGTIIAIDLPLKNPITPSELLTKEVLKTEDKVLINFL